MFLQLPLENNLAWVKGILSEGQTGANTKIWSQSTRRIRAQKQSTQLTLTRFSPMSFLLVMLHCCYTVLQINNIFLGGKKKSRAVTVSCSEEHFNGENWLLLTPVAAPFSSLLRSGLQQALQQLAPYISDLSTKVFIIPCFIFVV